MVLRVFGNSCKLNLSIYFPFKLELKPFSPKLAFLLLMVTWCCMLVMVLWMMFGLVRIIEGYRLLRVGDFWYACMDSMMVGWKELEWELGRRWNQGISWVKLLEALLVSSLARTHPKGSLIAFVWDIWLIRVTMCILVSPNACVILWLYLIC